MIASLTATNVTRRGLRPFNPLRDLRPAAELIELAFGEDLEPASREMLREMRSMAWLLGPLLWVFAAFRLPVAEFFGGFVWDEDGLIVGNVTLHRRYKGYRGWFISNLAVHPDHRRKGIARHLVTAGVESARREGADRMSLEVRADNVPARRLYENLGFSCVGSVTRMKLDAARAATPVSSDRYQVDLVKATAWKDLLRLAEVAMSPEAREIMPPKAGDYRLTPARYVVANIGDLIRGQVTYRFAARTQTELAGTLTLRTGGLLLPHSLSLMVHPEHRGQVEEILLVTCLAAVQPSRSRPLLAKIHPSYSRAVELFERHGFEEQETLDLLTKRLKPPQGGTK